MKNNLLMTKAFFALTVCFLFTLSSCQFFVECFGNEDSVPEEKVENLSLSKLSYDFNVKSFKNDYPAYEVKNCGSPDNLNKVCEAFGLSEDEIKEKFSADPVKGSLPEEDKIVLGLRQSDGSVVYTYSTENGFYFTPEGNLGDKENDVSFIKFDSSKLSFIVGCKKEKAVIGVKHFVRPVLTYKKDGVIYNAEFSFVYCYVNR